MVSGMRNPIGQNTRARGLGAAYLMAALGLVYCFGGAALADPWSGQQPVQLASAPPIEAGEAPAVNPPLEMPHDGPAEDASAADGLPQAVRDMRDAIVEAATSGDLEAMRFALEMNELMPTVSNASADRDPIRHWRKLSGKAEGRDILAILLNVIAAGHVHHAPGTPDEMFIWPGFAATPLESLSPEQRVELYRLAPPSIIHPDGDLNRYGFYRLGIGPDGVWHYFYIPEPKPEAAKPR